MLRGMRLDGSVLGAIAKGAQPKEAIELALPDAMELLGIAIAAGSPIEQCFREVAESMDGPLAREFSLVDREVNLLGRSREERLSTWGSGAAARTSAHSPPS